MNAEDKHFFTDIPNWQLMGLCIEREAGGESREGRIAVGTVILERVDHRNWDGKTIQEVILKPWQFSWTMDGKGVNHDYYEESVHILSHWQEEYDSNNALKECCQIAMGLLQGAIPRDPDLAKVNCCQYLNPVVAAKTKAEWLSKGMKLVKKIGHHEFFV